MPLDQRIEKLEGLEELVLSVYLMNLYRGLVGYFAKHNEGEVIWLI